MKMYLIDGYNLGHKIPRVVKFLNERDFSAAIEHIVRLVQQKLNVRKNRVIIVFDGKKGVFERPAIATSVEIRFSRKPQEADDLIRNFLRKSNDTGMIVVVSSDRAILNSARDLGAQTITSEEFCRSGKSTTTGSGLNQASEKPDPDQVDLNYWLEQFNNNRDEED